MDATSVSIAKSCLAIMCSVMSWKFRDARSARLPGALGQRTKHRQAEPTSTSAYSIISPGIGWAILGDLEALTMLMEAYTQLSFHPSLGFSTRQLVVQFGSLCGSTFRTEAMSNDH